MERRKCGEELDWKPEKMSEERRGKYRKGWKPMYRRRNYNNDASGRYKEDHLNGTETKRKKRGNKA